MVSPRCRRSLESLASSIDLVAVLTGRSALKAGDMVGISGIVYKGNHGLETWRGGELEIREEARERVPGIHATAERLRLELDVSGLIVEDKGVSASAHYRLSPDPERAREAILNALACMEEAQGMLITEGKLVVEVRPPVRVDKGTSLRELVAEYGLRGVICLGDDSTDVDAFRALHALASEGVCAGLSLGVLGRNTPAALEQEADLLLSGVAEVEELLERIVEAYPIRRPPAS